jgi:hypothetical protein
MGVRKGSPRRGSPLFRPEAVAGCSRASGWAPCCSPPQSRSGCSRPSPCFAASGLLGLLFFTDNTAKARIKACSCRRKGVVRVLAPHAGTIVDLAVSEGELVGRRRPSSHRVSTELRSDAVAATPQEIVQRLRERRASMAASASGASFCSRARWRRWPDAPLDHGPGARASGPGDGTPGDRLALAERTLGARSTSSARDRAVTRLDAAEEDRHRSGAQAPGPGARPGRARARPLQLEAEHRRRLWRTRTARRHRRRRRQPGIRSRRGRGAARDQW